jgi:hypothetical protein
MIQRTVAGASIALIFSLTFAPALRAQVTKWIVPPGIIDFSTPIPTTTHLQALDPGSDSRPSRVTNGAFNDSGRLLFYIKQTDHEILAYSANQTLAGTVVFASPLSPQISIIPVPASPDQFYVIYLLDSDRRLVLAYSVFNTVSMKFVSEQPTVSGPPLAFQELDFGALAVTRPRTDGTRLLYAASGSALDKFLIGPNNIQWLSSVFAQRPPRLTFFPFQVTLSSDGRHLAIFGSGGSGGVHVFKLDAQGDLVSEEVLRPTDGEILVVGLEFSCAGNLLFISDAQSGMIKYLDFHDTNPRFVELPGSQGYGNSILQLAANGKIYAASDDGTNLGEILPTSSPSFRAQVVTAINVGSVLGVQTLPSQVDGEPHLSCLCSNATLIQSNYGIRGNFEVVVPAPGGGMAHYSRDNDHYPLQWVGPEVFAVEVGTVDAVSMIESSYGNLEVVARIGHRLAHFYRDSIGQWHLSEFFATGVSGTPSLIQGHLGGLRNNFEVVTPIEGGGMARYSRENDAPFEPWSKVASFAQQFKVEEVSLIESTGGNLEVVARIGDQLAHFWYNDYFGLPNIWSAPTFFARGISGTPTLIQGNFGLTSSSSIFGNFEVAVPRADVGMIHYWRPFTETWQSSNSFGFAAGDVQSASLIESNYGMNFEVVAVSRLGCSLSHFYRSSLPNLTWSGPTVFAP